MKQSILELYQKHHRGKENAIPRDAFLLRYADKIPELSDRKFRDIYSELPICTCERGGFWPIRKSEVLEYREYLKKKAIPLFERWRMVSDAHTELMDGESQMELFRVIGISE